MFDPDFGSILDHLRINTNFNILFKNIKDVNFDIFIEKVNNASAIRRIQKLQPIGGKGDYIAPPTYKLDKDKTGHIFETRRIENHDSRCVLLDSVQSQANRLEDSLIKAIKLNRLNIPRLEVNFENELKDIGIISTLNAPHRIFDAIIRDSELDSKKFPDTDIGKKVYMANVNNASALFKYSPTTLIFGGWNSTGPKGGSGSRFQRCMVSEIIGVGATEDNQKPGSRLDPLEIEKVENKISGKGYDWIIKDGGKSKPSDINHGNIPPSRVNLGTTVDYALQTTTITFAGLRYLKFPDENMESPNEQNLAGWTVLAALALVAITEQDRNGYCLRSRCDLIVEKSSDFELLNINGEIEKIAVTTDKAHELLKKAIENAKKNGLTWNTEPITLLPQEKLIKLIKLSREKSLKDD